MDGHPIILSVVNTYWWPQLARQILSSRNSEPHFHSRYRWRVEIEGDSFVYLSISVCMEPDYYVAGHTLTIALSRSPAMMGHSWTSERTSPNSPFEFF